MKVFLGGTCNNSTWRQNFVIHLSDEIDYFNPVVEDWNKEAQKKELYEREHCDVVLYAITPKMKGVYSIAEVIEDSIKRPEKTVFCIISYEYSDEIGDDIVFDEDQIKSLTAVGEMVKKNGGKFFTNYCDVAEYLNALVVSKS